MRTLPKSRARIGFMSVVGRYRWARHNQFSLQFRRNFADKILDPFSFVPVTNQKCILGSNDNEVMNSKQCDRRAVFLENNVVAGIDRGNGTVRGVSLFVLLKVIRHCSPASTGTTRTRSAFTMIA